MLLRLGNLVGKAIKPDKMSELQARGAYARVCVQLDLTKSLVPQVRINSSVYMVEYEGLHAICLYCGRYGHKKEECSELKPASPVETRVSGSEEEPGGEDGNQAESGRPKYGTWMIAKRRSWKGPNSARGGTYVANGSGNVGSGTRNHGGKGADPSRGQGGDQSKGSGIFGGRFDVLGMQQNEDVGQDSSIPLSVASTGTFQFMATRQSAGSTPNDQQKSNGKGVVNVGKGGPPRKDSSKGLSKKSQNPKFPTLSIGKAPLSPSSCLGLEAPFNPVAAEFPPLKATNSENNRLVRYGQTGSSPSIPSSSSSSHPPASHPSGPIT